MESSKSVSLCGGAKRRGSKRNGSKRHGSKCNCFKCSSKCLAKCKKLSKRKNVGSKRLSKSTRKVIKGSKRSSKSSRKMSGGAKRLSKSTRKVMKGSKRRSKRSSKSNRRKTDGYKGGAPTKEYITNELPTPKPTEIGPRAPLVPLPVPIPVPIQNQDKKPLIISDSGVRK